MNARTGAGHGSARGAGLGDDRGNSAAPIAVHVISGFLGSGKTTLLNRMIRDPALANSAVVVNEFGDVGVDHLLVSQGSDSDTTLALIGGCLCCEVRDGLALTLVDLLARRQRGQCMAFERIIIETTGLANPTPILNLLATDPLLAELTIIGSVLTVVDALNAHTTLATFPEAVAQVVLADQIVVTKTDLDRDPAPDDFENLAQQLRAMNRDAILHEAGVGALPSLSCLLTRAQHAAMLHEPTPDAEHSHLRAANIHTFSVVRESPVPGAALTLFVQALAAQLGTDLLRVKGFVYVAESAHRPMLLQGAQRVFHPLVPLDAGEQTLDPQTCPTTRLVFIVRGPVRDFVEQLFDALIWEATEISARLVQSTPSVDVGKQAKENVSCWT